MRYLTSSTGAGRLFGRMKDTVERYLIDPLFPLACEQCSAAVVGEERVLCAACMEKLTPIDRIRKDRCCRCDAIMTGTVCECTTAAFGTNRSLFDYEDVSMLMHRMKFSKRYSLARMFGTLMAEREADYIRRHDVIIPVPLHPRRRRERGYDQARIIAHAAGSAGVPVCEAAARRRYTRALTLTESAAERRVMVADAFSITDEDALCGRAVLLIDDVVTTGSTLSELARCVCEAGARCADVLSIARA